MHMDRIVVAGLCGIGASFLVRLILKNEPRKLRRGIAFVLFFLIIRAVVFAVIGYPII